jgi:hypothetical protein
MKWRCVLSLFIISIISLHAATPPETGCLAPNIWDIQIRMDVRVWVNITLFVKPATELLREMMFMRGLDIGGLSTRVGTRDNHIFLSYSRCLYIFVCGGTDRLYLNRLWVLVWAALALVVDRIFVGGMSVPGSGSGSSTWC